MSFLQHDGTPTPVGAWPEANFDRTIQLTPGATITHIGEYSTAAVFAICLVSRWIVA